MSKSNRSHEPPTWSKPFQTLRADNQDVQSSRGTCTFPGMSSELEGMCFGKHVELTTNEHTHTLLKPCLASARWRIALLEMAQRFETLNDFHKLAFRTGSDKAGSCAAGEAANFLLHQKYHR